MNSTDRFIYWLPRIICILAILFVSMFAMDSFSPDLTVGQQIVGFLIHLIPSFIMIVILVVAWKWERVGGIILLIISLIFSVFVFLINYRRIHSVAGSLGIVAVICFPFVISGILFLMSHHRRNKAL